MLCGDPGGTMSGTPGFTAYSTPVRQHADGGVKVPRGRTEGSVVGGVAITGVSTGRGAALVCTGSAFSARSCACEGRGAPWGQAGPARQEGRRRAWALACAATSSTPRRATAEQGSRMSRSRRQPRCSRLWVRRVHCHCHDLNRRLPLRAGGQGDEGEAEPSTDPWWISSSPSSPSSYPSFRLRQAEDVMSIATRTRSQVRETTHGDTRCCGELRTESAFLPDFLFFFSFFSAS